ncbi:MAG: DUF4834 family protein [Tannerella sp.]|jgi:hypothetical protein|nr:DUF4834 family protein [Tannerella sp.]
MFAILKFIFFFGLILTLLLGFSVSRIFKSVLFGNSNRRRTQSRSSDSSGRKRTRNSQTSSKKIIPKDEGEYIDYEEIKE